LVKKLIKETKKDILEKLKNTRANELSIIYDPMNGCPEDFREDYDRMIKKLVLNAWSLGATSDETDNAIKMGEKEYENTSPWLEHPEPSNLDTNCRLKKSRNK
jgi:recombinational DNA repair protein RecT